MRKTTEQAPQTGAKSTQMGSAASSSQPQQSGGAPEPEPAPRKPVLFTDWASI